MRDSIDRWRLAVKIHVISSNQFASASTILVSFVFTPALSLLFVVSLAMVMGARQVLVTAYATTLINVLISVVSSVAATIARDRQLGVIQTTAGVVLRRPSFWLAVMTVPVTASSIVGWMTALCVYGLDPGHDASLLFGALLLVVATSVAGCGLAIFSASLGLTFRDPYLCSNIIGGLVVLTSSIVAPIESYPRWASVVCQYLPGTSVVRAFRAINAGLWPDALLLVGREFLTVALFAAVGLLAAHRIFRSVRLGTRSLEVF